MNSDYNADMDPDRFIIEDEFVKVEGDTRLSYVSVWLRSKVDQKVTIGEHNYVMPTYRNQKAEVIFVNLISFDRNFQADQACLAVRFILHNN